MTTVVTSQWRRVAIFLSSFRTARTSRMTRVSDYSLDWGMQSLSSCRQWRHGTRDDAETPSTLTRCEPQRRLLGYSGTARRRAYSATLTHCSLNVSAAVGSASSAPARDAAATTVKPTSTGATASSPPARRFMRLPSPRRPLRAPTTTKIGRLAWKMPGSNVVSGSDWLRRLAGWKCGVLL